MTNLRFTAAASRRRQAGVTLVELMVSMVLGLIVTAGIIQIFIGNRATYAFNDSLSLIQENARYALEHVANNARMAGHLGCLSNVAVRENLAGAPNPFRDDLATGLQGYDFNGTGVGDPFAAGAVNPAPLGTANSWTPTLAAALVGRVIPGSDVLVVRYVSGPSTAVVSPFGTLSQLQVATPHAFSAGQVLVVTDCQKASIFQLTGVTGGGVNLLHAAGGGFSPGNNPGVWPPQQSYGLGSEVSTLETIAFYVGRGAAPNNAPSLFQLRLQRTTATATAFLAEELVNGIDTMQVRYGMDTDADAQVDAWRSADVMTAADWANVLSVEITLLARAAEEYGTETDTAVYNIGGVQFDPVDDRRLRHVFTTTVGLRNRLP